MFSDFTGKKFLVRQGGLALPPAPPTTFFCGLNMVMKYVTVKEGCQIQITYLMKPDHRFY